MGTKDPFNLPEAEFDAVMTEIDQKLRQKGDRIPGREIGGIAEYCSKFNVPLANYDPTTKRIIDWFTRIYGDRLNMDWDGQRTDDAVVTPARVLASEANHQRFHLGSDPRSARKGAVSGTIELAGNQPPIP